MASTDSFQGIDEERAKELIRDSGQIHLHEFRVALGVLTGVAFVCFLGRIAIRIRYQKRLLLDDVFLIFAACCMSVAIGIIYDISWFLYMHTAAAQIPELLPYLISNYKSLLGMHTKVYPTLAMQWCTIYAVKACFLSFMRPLVWHISKTVNRYYWFIVWFSLLCWAVAISMPFMVCPYFGDQAVKCFSFDVDRTKSFALTVLVTVLDILTDLMVVSLPIIILRRSMLSTSTKFGLAVFLGLSIFMCVCAAVRAGGYHYNNVEDDTWAFFWMQTEGAVAIMMASLTAFRTLFVKTHGSSGRNRGGKPENSPPSENKLSSSLLRRLLSHIQTLAKAQPEEVSPKGSDPEFNGATASRNGWKLPKIPSPAFTGVRTFIRRNGRTTGAGGATSVMRTDVSGKTYVSVESTIDASESDYHAQLMLREFESGGGAVHYQGGLPGTPRKPMTPRSAQGYGRDF